MVTLRVAWVVVRNRAAPARTVPTPQRVDRETARWALRGCRRESASYIEDVPGPHPRGDESALDLAVVYDLDVTPNVGNEEPRQLVASPEASLAEPVAKHDQTRDRHRIGFELPRRIMITLR